MAISSVLFRNPFPPHEGRAIVDVQAVSYGRLLMRPSTASFQVRVGNAALDDLEYQFGALISIERDDGLFPWVGMVTKRQYVTGSPMIQFEAKDHAGALFARASTADALISILSTLFGGGGMASVNEFLNGDAASQIEAVLSEVAERNSPPLLVDYDLAHGGPPVSLLPEGAYVLDYLQEMHNVTGWEWGLGQALDFSAVATRLLWRERIGRDLRGEIVWEEGRHVANLKFTQDASKFIETAVVISTGIADADQEDLLRVTAVCEARKTLPPVLRGSVLEVRHSTKDISTLQAEAERLCDDPTNRGEHVSMEVVESTINEPVDPGDRLRVRFKDAGKSVERTIRVMGTQHASGTGVIEVEADVEPEAEE